MTNPNQLEAVVLQAMPFKEYDRILTLFSPQGLLKLFVKGKKKEYLRLAALTSPLTRAEFHYTPGRKELHRLLEGSIVAQNLRLREHYETLTAAERMVQALLQSQWQGKPAPKLYSLFCLFLETLPSVKDPNSLTTLFLLKILRHEGILQLKTPFTPCFRFGGELYSEKEAPAGALFFTEEEEVLLAELVLCRTLSQVADYSLSQEYKEKIEKIFLQSFT